MRSEVWIKLRSALRYFGVVVGIRFNKRCLALLQNRVQECADFAPSLFAFFQKRSKILKVVPHSVVFRHLDVDAVVPCFFVEHIVVAFGSFGFSALDQHGRKIGVFGVGGGQILIVRGGISYVSDDSADVLFVFLKTLIFRQRIERIAIAVLLIRTAGCGKVDATRYRDDRVGQREPSIAKSQANRQQNVRAETVADRDDFFTFEIRCNEICVRCVTLVVYGRVDQFFSRPVVDRIDRRIGKFR